MNQPRDLPTTTGPTPRASVVGLALIGLLAVGCGVSSPTATIPEAAPVASPEGTIVPGPPLVGDVIEYYESFDEVVAEQPVVVVVRATDHVWRQRPPGGDADADRAYEEALPSEGPVSDTFFYQWREYEVVEVLHSDYDKPTLNYGDFLDRAEAGKTYVLFAHVLMARGGDFWGTDQDFGEGIPPYELTADSLLVSTDPTVQVKLPATLTLAELREQIDG